MSYLGSEAGTVVASVFSTMSVIGDGSSPATAVRLVNDATFPGSGRFYGVSESGQKGYISPRFVVCSTNFGDYTAINPRYIQTFSGASSATLTAVGLDIVASGIGGASADIQLSGPANMAVFGENTLVKKNISWGGQLGIKSASSKTAIYFGTGGITVNAANIVTTDNHIGFKLVENTGAFDLYATNADGVTEKATLANVVVAVNDFLDLHWDMYMLNGRPFIDYFYRKNGGIKTLIATHDVNIPTAGNLIWAQIGLTTGGNPGPIEVIANTSSYLR